VSSREAMVLTYGGVGMRCIFLLHTKLSDIIDEELQEDSGLGAKGGNIEGVLFFCCTNRHFLVISYYRRKFFYVAVEIVLSEI